MGRPRLPRRSECAMPMPPHACIAHTPIHGAMLLPPHALPIRPRMPSYRHAPTHTYARSHARCLASPRLSACSPRAARRDCGRAPSQARPQGQARQDAPSVRRRPRGAACTVKRRASGAACKVKRGAREEAARGAVGRRRQAERARKARLVRFGARRASARGRGRDREAREEERERSSEKRAARGAGSTSRLDGRRERGVSYP